MKSEQKTSQDRHRLFYREWARVHSVNHVHFAAVHRRRHQHNADFVCSVDSRLRRNLVRVGLGLRLGLGLGLGLGGAAAAGALSPTL